MSTKDIEKGAVALDTLTQAASASERAAQKWGMTTDAAGRSSEEFSKRVKRNIEALGGTVAAHNRPDRGLEVVVRLHLVS